MSIDVDSLFPPKDIERLPFLTRVSKMGWNIANSAENTLALLDLCWYMDQTGATPDGGSVLHFLVPQMLSITNAFAESMTFLGLAVLDVQGMLKSLYHFGGLTSHQIRTLNQWESEMTVESCFVYIGSRKGLSEEYDHLPGQGGAGKEASLNTDVVLLEDLQKTRIYTRQELRLDRIVKRQMLDALTSLRKERWEIDAHSALPEKRLTLGFCDGCNSVFVAQNTAQTACSKRCSARIRKRRQQERK